MRVYSIHLPSVDCRVLAPSFGGELLRVPSEPSLCTSTYVEGRCRWRSVLDATVRLWSQRRVCTRAGSRAMTVCARGCGMGRHKPAPGGRHGDSPFHTHTRQHRSFPYSKTKSMVQNPNTARASTDTTVHQVWRAGAFFPLAVTRARKRGEFEKRSKTSFLRRHSSFVCPLNRTVPIASVACVRWLRHEQGRVAEADFQRCSTW